MDIYFENSKIKKICSSKNKAILKYGKDNADYLFRRLIQIQAAENLEQLRLLPGHYHRLTGNLNGKWACTIRGGLRLIFAPKENGKVLLSDITEVTLVGLIDYH